MAMTVEGMPKGWTARVLMLQGAEGSAERFDALVYYMQAHPIRSSTWQDTAARGLGLLWDFTRARGAELAAKAKFEGRWFLDLHLRAFALALSNGTMDNDSDPSELYWPRTGLARSKTILAAIDDFARWGAASWPAHDGLDPDHVPGDAPAFAAMLALAHAGGIAVARHLSAGAAVLDRPSSPRPTWATNSGIEAVHSFPKEHAARLVWEGHMRPGREREPNDFLRFNVRDQMMALLDGWGGLRRSEGLHLWVQDVAEDPERPGHALVFLHHPSEALVEVPDPLSRRVTRMSRQAALQSRYRLMPRHMEKRGRYHVGWKGMDLDQTNCAVVHWRDDAAAQMFWLLYLGYLRYVRKQVMDRRRENGGPDHPFLFVSEGSGRNRTNAASVGDPYSAKAYERNHEAAVGRIGLRYAKAEGTTTHGLRHLYGQTLSDWGMSAAVIRKALRHSSYLSQAVYVAPSRAKVDAILRGARGGSGAHSVAVEELGGSESARAIHRLAERINGIMPT